MPNGFAGTEPVRISVEPSATVRLSAKGTRDPDGQRVTVRWWRYAAPSAAPSIVPPVLKIAGADGEEASFAIPAIPRGSPKPPQLTPPPAYHVIL